jgi:transposase
MAMGTRKHRRRQEQLWVTHTELATAPGHPFYERLNQLLDSEKFDEFCERECAQFYADNNGRPSLTPGTYFRLLLVGYFEGIDSERGIAWRTADSLGLRQYLGFGLDEKTPDHSTISRTRRLIDVETHHKVFLWVLGVLADRGLLKGKTVGVDATTLEANAAMRAIVRRDNGATYDEFLTGLAQQSGIETPSREDLARVDRKRKKKGSNKEWMSPSDPDARITRMKDGTTHLAHKAEHAVDMETGAVIAVTLQAADQGDTTTIKETLAETAENLAHLIEREGDSPEEEPEVSLNPLAEVVADKGYHSDETMLAIQNASARSYIPEPKRPQRNWAGKADAKKAVNANRRRIKGRYSKRLMKKRGELIERSFAHCYETGAMRRVFLRGRENVLKRQLIHVGAFNLSLIFRQALGAGTPRELRNRQQRPVFVILVLGITPWMSSARASRFRTYGLRSRRFRRLGLRNCCHQISEVTPRTPRGGGCAEVCVNVL